MGWSRQFILTLILFILFFFQATITYKAASKSWTPIFMDPEEAGKTISNEGLSEREQVRTDHCSPGPLTTVNGENIECLVLNGLPSYDDIVVEGGRSLDLKNIRMDLKGGRLLILDRSSVSFSNIVLSNAILQVRSDNFKMDGCLFERCNISVDLRSSGRIINSTYENTTVSIMGGTGVPIHNNRFMNSVLEMDGSSGLDIRNNLFYGRLPEAYNNSISLHLNHIRITGKRNSILNNTFESCHWGIQPDDVGSMGPIGFYCYDVVGNYFGNCTFAMVLVYCDFYQDNIWANTFYHNGGTGDSGDGEQIWIAINAMPNGQDDIFHHKGIGNCWWNHRTPDSDGNGIVDEPLFIDTDYYGFDHYDAYPLTDDYRRLFRPRIEISSPGEGTYPFKDLEIRWNITNLKYDVVKREMKIDDGDWKEVPNDSSMKMTFEKGEHTIIVRAENEVGLVNQSSVRFTVSYDPSVLTILQPIDGAYIPDGKVRVEWAVREGFLVGNIEISVGNDTYFPESGNRSMDLLLPDGRYKLQLTLADIGGISIVKDVNFNVDTTPPKVVIEGLANGYVLSQRLVAINWSISENMELISMCYELNEEGPKELPIAVRGTFKVFLDPGHHNIGFLAVDAALHVTEVRIGFKIAEGTEGLVLTPQEGLMTNKDKVRVTWRDPDWMELSSIRISGNVLIQTQVLKGTNESLVPLPEDGLYELKVEFFDLTGNSYQERRTVIRDTWEPVLIIPEGVILFNTTSPSLNWTAFDDRALGHFKIGLDRGPLTDIGLRTKVQLDHLDEGNHVLTVMAVDLAGNSVEGTLPFIIDTIPPEIVLLGVEDGMVLTDHLLELMWYAEDENGIGLVRLCLDGEWTEAEAQGTYQRGVSSGAHTLSLNVTDTAGNSNELSLDFFIDTERPRVTWTMGPPKYTNDSLITFGWQANDDAMIAITKVLVDGTAQGPLNISNECSISLIEGNHNISVTVIDIAGRSTTISRNVVVDKSVPSLGNLSVSLIGKKWVLTVEAFDELSGIQELKVVHGVRTYSTPGSHISINLGDRIPTQVQIGFLVTDRAGNTIEGTRTLINKTSQETGRENHVIGLVIVLVITMLVVIPIVALFIHRTARMRRDPRSKGSMFNHYIEE